MAYNQSDIENGVDNIRLSCDRCGKWGRLYKNDEQYFFPGYIPNDSFVEMYHDICTPCVDFLNTIKKELDLAYKAGLEQQT